MKTLKTYIAIAISFLTFSGIIAQNSIEESALNTTTSNRMAATNRINYQAVARDATGALMTSAAITIDFEIRDTAGGQAVFSETQNLGTDSNGVFSTEIGAVNSLAGVEWQYIEPWLHVSLNGTSVGLTRMASVPYAFYANYAQYAETVANAVERLNDLADAKTGANDYSVYIGTDAGFFDSGTDNFNVGIGFESLKSNSVGNSNTATGFQALNANTTGNSNSATGYKALVTNTTGSFNVATGHNALLLNTTGSYNSALGSSALIYNTAGVKNVAIGANSLYYNTTGAFNSANGYEALNKNISGDYNTASGHQAMFSNTIGSFNTASGKEALKENISGDLNVASGFQALIGITTGDNNTGIGSFSGSQIFSGSNNTAIGYLAQVPNGGNNNQVRIGNNLVQYAGVQVGWSVTSDRRLKSNIEASNLGLDFIKALKPVVYERNNDENKKAEYGFIAQELEGTLKEFGATNNGIITIDDNGMYSLRYNDLIAVLTKAMQEQQEVIDNLQATVNKLLANKK